MSLRDRLAEFARVELAPPQYLTLPTAGIDVSASAIKVATLADHLGGLRVAAFGDERLVPGAVTGGEISEKAGVTAALKEIAHKYGVRRANIALPESRGYLFEATVTSTDRDAWRTEIEQHIDEYVPLPPAEVSFDAAPLATENGQTHMIGVGYARRVIDESLAVFEDAGIEVRSIESETFALPRALLPHGDTATVLIIDIGKSSTKLLVVSKRLPRLATTLNIGGHALTLAVQKYFGVTEEEAKQVKAERGLTPGADNDEYIAAMLSTVSVIREEIVRRLDYWNSRQTAVAAHEPISRAIIVGGNATVRGLPEYLEVSLKIPVELGDVFTNLAPRTDWLPPVDYMESLAFGTSIGLALREFVP
ncbi:MAG: pilus assembly protein PilM [Candidatus Pacebacteria bacterium]|nr:pilus assembly protein PilM [Candidatus Paceibacterota bacterium]